MEKDTQSSDLVNSAKEEVIDEILCFTATRVGYRLVSAVQLKKQQGIALRNTLMK